LIEMTHSDDDHDPLRVLIAGGGVAALETLLALRELASRHVAVKLLTPSREFVYRPVTVAEAFGRGEARSYPLAEIVADQHARLVWDSLKRVDAERRVVLTGLGDAIRYDRLVIAMGAVPRDPLPGALTFGGRHDVAAMRELLDELVGGEARSVAFALPSQRMWALPLYELALMTAESLGQRGGSAVRVTLVTPEEEPLELFGSAAGDAMRALLEARGITLRTSSMPAMVGKRVLMLAGGGELFVDRVVTVPDLEGPGLPGIPQDRRGFIPVDAHGRVIGAECVYAAGDATAFPLKQGGLAAQQADAVAEAIAAEAGAELEPHPFHPVLRGLLMTGGAPLYLRAEPHRIPRESSVAIEAATRLRGGHDASAATGQALWWPPAKIAGRYLSPYLATARPRPLSGELLSDRSPVPGPPVSDAEYRDALELAYLLAGLDARWGDYRSALDALDAAEALEGALPPEYEAMRREWRAAARTAR
jgi:sulfide:quinone oxidoreductase